MRSKMFERAQRALSEKVFPGAVVGVVHKSGERLILPFGHHTYETHSREVDDDTVYDMASVTKSIPVASLIATYIEQGKMALADAVTTFIPELKGAHGATIEDLLRYRVKGPRMSQMHLKTFEEIRTAVLERGFDGPPGDEQYSNVPAFLLGMVAERVGGSILPALGEAVFFKPLKMYDTSFFFHDTIRIAPTEVVDGEEVRGIVHDESARVFSRARRAVGHAGLFSTTPDMLKFFEALLAGQLPPVLARAQTGLGWQVAQRWFMGNRCSPKAFGKTGFTGTSVLCDVQHGTALVILSNRTYPTRPPDAASLTSAINALRADIADIVFS